MFLEAAPIPQVIIRLGTEGIVKIWREHKMRSRGASIDRAQTLVEVAHNSVGKRGGIRAKMELEMLLEDFKIKEIQLEKVTAVMEEMTMRVPNADNMLSVKEVGLVTAAGFIAEVWDISRFRDTKQVQKYAGFELVENNSGKHKGKTTISKRVRKRLRRILYQVILPLIQNNNEFRDIYNYYRNRIRNPLKGRQAMSALCYKLIRVFYAMLKNGIYYKVTIGYKSFRDSGSIESNLAIVTLN